MDPDEKSVKPETEENIGNDLPTESTIEPAPAETAPRTSNARKISNALGEFASNIAGRKKKPETEENIGNDMPTGSTIEPAPAETAPRTSNARKISNAFGGFAANISGRKKKSETEENIGNNMPTENTIEPTPAETAPRTSNVRKISNALGEFASSIGDKVKKRFSSQNAEPRVSDIEDPPELTRGSPSTSKGAVTSASKDTSRESSKLKVISADDGSKHKGVLKRSEESGLTVGSAPVKFSPVVDVNNPKYQPRKSYNPFSSFEKNIPISNPNANKKSVSVVSSDYPKSYSIASSYKRGSNVSDIQRGKRISVVDLSKQNIAFCFFPEEPDWDDDDDDDYPRRLTFGYGPDDYYEDKEDLEWSERARWDSRLVYLIALITYSISFSNIYHFPLLVYTYSGLFLIPYTIFTIILGYPLHFLESALGQYSQSGPVKVWDSIPIARGVGWSMFVLCLFIAYFYNMYAAYSVIYFSGCFKTILPWQDCDESSVANNFSCVPRMCARSDVNQHTPSEHYFIDHILRLRFPNGEALGSGLGAMMWKQFLGFFLAWFVVYVAIIQSVRSIGKCVYFLIVLPYFVLLMMLTAGFMLEGSSRAWYLLFGASDKAKLFDIQMWRSAAEQVFFELGICQGIPLVYGSYCHHRNPTHIDSGIICIINYCTSILCALVLFNLLGALSLEMGKSVDQVTNKVAGLVFIMYSDALCRVPASNFWCILFFLMLFSVIIGTQIGVMETVMTVIYDEFPNALPYRWLINMLTCFGLFLIGLVLCTSNGFFVVHLLDRMTGSLPRLPIAVFMVGAIVGIYGLRKFSEDMHFMIDYFPNLFMRVCLFITPFLLIILTVASWVSMKNLTIFDMEYDQDAIHVGWFTVSFILIWIPIGAIYWISHCFYLGQLKLTLHSLNSWGPKNLKARIARTEFSSDHVSNFTNPWTKRQSSSYMED